MKKLLFDDQLIDKKTIIFKGKYLSSTAVVGYHQHV